NAAQPLAERANDPDPQEDTEQPVIETEAPARPRDGSAKGEAMGHHTTTGTDHTMTATPADAAKASKPLHANPVPDDEATEAPTTTPTKPKQKRKPRTKPAISLA